MNEEKNIKKDFPIEQWANPTNESVNADKPLALPASVEPNYPKESGATGCQNGQMSACQNGEMSVCQNGEIYSPNCQSGQDLAAEGTSIKIISTDRSMFDITNAVGIKTGIVAVTDSGIANKLISLCENSGE